jgi:hypothetical protein
MIAYVIMHTAIVEDGCEGVNKLQGCEFQGPLITREHLPQEFEAYLQIHGGTRHQATPLKLDLVEHL